LRAPARSQVTCYCARARGSRGAFAPAAAARKVVYVLRPGPPTARSVNHTAR